MNTVQQNTSSEAVHLPSFPRNKQKNPTKCWLQIELFSSLSRLTGIKNTLFFTKLSWDPQKRLEKKKRKKKRLDVLIIHQAFKGLCLTVGAIKKNGKTRIIEINCLNLEQTALSTDCKSDCKPLNYPRVLQAPVLPESQMPQVGMENWVALWPRNEHYDRF